MSANLQAILDRMNAQRVLVVGDYMLDEYLDGRVERISPEAPVPIVLQTDCRYLPGGAGNVVCNLRSLGAETELLGTIGKDGGGTELRQSFLDLGIAPERIGLLEIPDRPTTRKTRILAGAHQMLRLDREDSRPLSMDYLAWILAELRGRLPKCQAVIISDYDKGLITPSLISELMRLAREHNIFVAVDPQVTHFSYYKEVDLLTPNHHEAGRFVGRRLDSTADIEVAGFEILDRLQARNLLITRGEKGMSLFSASDRQNVLHIPTQAREVFDVTGAGDTVIAVLSLAVAAGATLAEAARLSNKAAGQVVAHFGAATVNVEDLRK
ncbi:MAG: D-glycero-beta-D-manno-heptose-7-phosphate kinase [Leptospiraceae bacterium]|nr:D-glycero-beta-D-manno-heptose-7-phosphate kinase [Leptospiraceae bacterium]